MKYIALSHAIYLSKISNTELILINIIEEIISSRTPQLGFLMPAELHELDPPIEVDQREDQHEKVRDDFQHGIGAPAEFRPDVDLEMRAFLDPDHGAEHDHPDEQKARQLLRPDVARDQLGIARDDLQRDRNHQDRDGCHHQPGQELAIAVDQLFHAREVAADEGRGPRGTASWNGRAI